MKKAPVIILIVAAAASGLGIWQEWRPLFTLYHQHVEALTLPDEPTTPNGLPKLAAAVKKYTRDHVSRGQALPASVTLRDLVSGGYLSTNDVRDLHLVDFTIYPLASNREPHAVLCQMRTSDGRQITVLADGSVQQLPR